MVVAEVPYDLGAYAQGGRKRTRRTRRNMRGGYCTPSGCGHPYAGGRKRTRRTRRNMRGGNCITHNCGYPDID